MIEAPVTDNRLLHVLAHLWPRGVDELQRMGRTLEDTFYRFRHFAATGYKARVLEFDGAPVVVVGIAFDELGAFTWFQATGDFDRHASAITRYVRREAAAFPGPLSIYSTCVHPDTARWFRVLGFRRDETYSCVLPSGATQFKFDRR